MGPDAETVEIVEELALMHLDARRAEREESDVQTAALTLYCGVRLGMSFHRGALLAFIDNPGPVQKMVDLLFTGEGLFHHLGVDQRIIPWVPTPAQMNVLFPDGSAGRPSILFAWIAERALNWTCEHLVVTVPQDEFEKVAAEIEEDVGRRMKLHSVVVSSLGDSLFPTFFRAFKELGGTDEKDAGYLLQFARANTGVVIRALWLAYDEIVRRVDLKVTPAARTVGYNTDVPFTIEADARRRFRIECARSEGMLLL